LNTITIYHGTTYDFTEIDPRKGKPFKDFGQGFYTTQSHDHALSIADRNRRIELERIAAYGRTENVKLFVYKYAFSMPDLEKIRVLRFDNPNADWVDFVVKNRTERKVKHGYDLIIGKTANDDTRITIQNYLFGAYGEPGTPKAVKVFLEQIKVEKLPIQWMFATTRSTNLLRFESREHVL